MSLLNNVSGQVIPATITRWTGCLHYVQGFGLWVRIASAPVYAWVNFFSSALLAQKMILSLAHWFFYGTERLASEPSQAASSLGRTMLYIQLGVKMSKTRKLLENNLLFELQQNESMCQERCRRAPMKVLRRCRKARIWNKIEQHTSLKLWHRRLVGICVQQVTIMHARIRLFINYSLPEVGVQARCYLWGGLERHIEKLWLWRYWEILPSKPHAFEYFHR
jgi:hypothetical protein